MKFDWVDGFKIEVTRVNNEVQI